jgi:hypothetical protein
MSLATLTDSWKPLPFVKSRIISVQFLARWVDLLINIPNRPNTNELAQYQQIS